MDDIRPLLKIVKRYGPLDAKSAGIHAGFPDSQASGKALRMFHHAGKLGYVERGAVPGNRYKWSITAAGIGYLKSPACIIGDAIDARPDIARIGMTPWDVIEGPKVTDPAEQCITCGGWGFVMMHPRDDGGPERANCGNCYGTGRRRGPPADDPLGLPALHVAMPPVAPPADATGIMLAERGSRYGPFTGHAALTQTLKDGMYATLGWHRLEPYQREALDMVQHKIGRILNGDPRYLDSWDDIIGYVRLVVEELERQGVTRP